MSDKPTVGRIEQLTTGDREPMIISGDANVGRFSHLEIKDMKIESLQSEIEGLRGEVERYKQILNPRTWTKEQHDAWHSAIPDTMKAFELIQTDKEVV